VKLLCFIEVHLFQKLVGVVGIAILGETIEKNIASIHVLCISYLEALSL
jgi:hypothetical protein